MIEITENFDSSYVRVEAGDICFNRPFLLENSKAVFGRPALAYSEYVCRENKDEIRIVRLSFDSMTLLSVPRTEPWRIKYVAVHIDISAENVV